MIISDSIYSIVPIVCSKLSEVLLKPSFTLLYLVKRQKYIHNQQNGDGKYYWKHGRQYEEGV